MNGAGKTTWINSRKPTGAKILSTHIANPLRWSNKKKKVVTIGGMSNYCLGFYDAIYSYVLIENVKRNIDVFWDRTFISAYVYYTINKYAFELLAKQYLSIDTEIIFLDTDVNICKERYLKRGIKEYVDKKLNWDEIQKRFHKTISKLKIMGYNIKIIKNYEV